MKRIKRKRVHTGGARVPGMPFMGEVMECEICHKKEKSNPKVESGWTAIRMDAVTKYICPACFGNKNLSENYTDTKRV